jgi:uncharacterized Zn finger protein
MKRRSPSASPAASRTESWWSSRWLAALEPLVDRERMAKGRWHARAGRVVRLDVAPPDVVAYLQGGQAKPRRVALRIRPLSDAAWERVAEVMASQARCAAALLNGELPPWIEVVFKAAGTSLLPSTQEEIGKSCICSDGPSHCKHITAVYHALGARFDADPFLILALRGRSRLGLLAAVRDSRHRQTGLSPTADARPGDRPHSAVSLEEAHRTIARYARHILDLGGHQRPSD